MAGTTIDQYDMSVYSMYAWRTMITEQINQQLRLREAASIPPQIQIVDIYPRLPELDILFGIIPLHAPWAYFFPPKKFRTSRRSPFAFSRVAPSFGLLSNHEDELVLLEEYECHNQEEQQEKKALMGVIKEMKKINGWMGYIVGKMGQFLQG